MNFSKRLKLLQSVEADPALLALLTVDMAYPDESAVERDALKQALLAAAIPHWCDPPFLASLLAVEPCEADRLHERLCALTVIEPFPARGERAVNVHEASRLVLREHVRQTMPHHWRTLSIRARKYLEPDTSVHSRIESLHHLFAIDQEAAAAECEALELELLQNPEWHQALAVSLTEVAVINCWLQGSALVQAILFPLQVRFSRGETSTLGWEARALVELAETDLSNTGGQREPKLLGVTKSSGRLKTNSIGWFLSTIGRVPLLSPSEEIELAHHVQAGKKLQELPADSLTPQQRRRLRMAQRARDRMIAANLRLVVSVAKKYQNQGLELLNLVQEGALGLERAVDRFDAGRGYRFSTFAYWWIRQGMTLAINNNARTISVPIDISEKLSKMRRITWEISHRLGRQPNRLELAHGMGMEQEELEELMVQTAPYASMDAHALGEEDRSTLGELIANSAGKGYLGSMANHFQNGHLADFFSQLNEREQKILLLRFGLGGDKPLTLGEIGRQLNVSRERVRQLEARAIMKLRRLAFNASNEKAL